jgi:GT2 family glycosyltransferase
MFTFITSVKHPKNCFNYKRVWDLLRDTLFSVCSQTCKDFRVIVVCNKDLGGFDGIYRITKHTEVLTVDFPPPSGEATAHTGVRACNYDRGLKYLVGLLHAKQYDPDYVMFFDCDDFVSENIVATVNKQPLQSGWYCYRGLFLRNWSVAFKKEFHRICGTSHILNYEQLTKEIDFGKLSNSSSVAELLEHTNHFYVRGVLGCHLTFDSYFFNLFSSLQPFPDPGAVMYNIGNGENHSGNNEGIPSEGWHPIRKKDGRLERCVYQMNLPLVDNARQQIGICIPDARCRKALKLRGLYDPVGLSAQELVRIYDINLWRNYETLAYVVNPWERLAYAYENSSGSASFKEFLQTYNGPQQIDYISAGNSGLPDTILRVEDCEATAATHSSAFKKYYDAECLDIVEKKFPDDISQLGYAYDGFYTAPAVAEPVDTPIPNILHFTFGFSSAPEEFKYIYYLSILTAIHHNQPDTIYFHYYHEPFGLWWDTIKDRLTLNRIPPPEEIFGNKLTHYAHKSDVVRMEQLLAIGGIYLDLDVISLRSLAPLRNNQFVLGIQDSPYDRVEREYYGACNAVLMSAPNSKFLKLWYDAYTSFDSTGRDEAWDYHSVQVPYQLSMDPEVTTDDVHLVGPNAFFFPDWHQMSEFFLDSSSYIQHSNKFTDSFVVHLWETAEEVDVNKITPEYIDTSDSTLARYVKKTLMPTIGGSVSLVFLVHNRLDVVADCLTSYLLLAQTREDVAEVLIYDNDSDAETKEFLNRLNKHSLVRVITGEENIGVAGGRDVLFREAKGDVIFSLDSDSSTAWEGIIDEAKLILSDPSVGMCGVAGCTIEDMETFAHSDILSDEDYVGSVDSLAGCCQIFRKDALDYMKMDLNYVPFWLEDTDLCLQLRAAGFSIQRFASKGRFIHEWGATGDKLFPDSFNKKFEYFKSKWAV